MIDRPGPSRSLAVAARHATVMAVLGTATAMAKSVAAVPPVVMAIAIPATIIVLVAALVVAITAMILCIGNRRNAEAGDDQTRGSEHACNLHGRPFALGIRDAAELRLDCRIFPRLGLQRKHRLMPPFSSGVPSTSVSEAGDPSWRVSAVSLTDC